MAYPSVTYTLTNSTTADASQVQQNFADLIAGASDGTKDYSINALTLAGALTANGAVTLGNATSDDVTITGYLASALIPKTDDTYDLGTSALAWQDAYLDGALYTDTISELTSANGVVIDSVTLKDNRVKANGFYTVSGTAAECTTGANVDLATSLTNNQAYLVHVYANEDAGYFGYWAVVITGTASYGLDLYVHPNVDLVQASSPNKITVTQNSGSTLTFKYTITQVSVTGL